MRWPWAIAATLCAPLLFRAAALVDAAGRVSVVDAQGLLSDLGIAALGAACAVALVRVHRLLALPFVWLWTVAHYANYELVVTLGAPLSLRDTHYLFDPTFFAGSAIHLSQPGLLALAAGFSTLAIWLGVGARPARAPVVALAGLALAGLAAWLPDVPEQPVWRQVDFLQLIDNWRQFLRYQIMHERVQADLRQTLAELERAVGVLAPAGVRIDGGDAHPILRRLPFAHRRKV